MTTCSRCGASSSEAARFCPQCGAALEHAQRTGHVRKTVTILFADISGSTELGETIDAERLRSLMNRYFAAARDAIQRHGGTVEKFIGDAVVAVFGVPAAHEDDALRAVRAAVDVRSAVEELDDALVRGAESRLAVRIGVNTGDVVVGDAASAQSFVTGDAVNVAARLQASAAPMEILLGDATHRLVRREAVVEPVGPVRAKGKARPLIAWRLLGVTTPTVARARRRESPLVGRVRELRRLQQAFEDAVEEHRAELFTVLGAAGVGKSRLVAEFVATLPPDTHVVRGRCLAYGEGITYWALGEAVRMAAGISETDSAEEARRALDGLARGQDGERVAGLIASAVGLSAERATPSDIAWATRVLFEGMAAARPLVVILEDIHWAEPTFLDAVEHIVDTSRGHPLLIVCPARPELLDRRPTWGGGMLNATTMLLEALHDTDAERLLEAQPGGEALPRSLRSRIAAAAEGNPLFVEEMVAMLVDEGVLTRENGTWIAPADVDAVTVPPTIRALLTARLDGLVPDERAIATRASVAGRVFERDAAMELVPTPLRAVVPDGLMALVRKEVLRPERATLTAGEAFKFRHVLIRDAAYELLPKSERADLHERFADWLESVAGDRLTEYEEIVGYHLEQAHGYRVELGHEDERTQRLASRAAERLGAAGLRARVRQDARAAINLLGRALELMPTGDARHAEMRLERITALLYAARYDEAIAAASDVEGDPRSDPMIAARARMLRIWGLQGNDNLELPTLRRDVAAMLASVRRHRPLQLRSEAWQAVGDTAQDAGLMEASGRALTRSHALALRTGNPEQIADSELSLASHGLRSTMPMSEVRALIERHLNDVGHSLRSVALSNLAVALAAQGRYDEARARLDDRTRLSRDVGVADEDRTFNEGLIQLYAGNYARAHDLFSEARGHLDPDAQGNSCAWHDVRIAETASLLGRDAEALALTESALAAFPNHLWVATLGGATRATSLARVGRAEEALQQADAVLRRARAAHLELLPLIFGTALERLAAAHVALGRHEDARSLLDEALTMYERKGVVPWTVRVKGSLAALERPAVR